MTSLIGSRGVTLGGIRAIGLHMHLDMTLGLPTCKMRALMCLLELLTCLLATFLTECGGVGWRLTSVNLSIYPFGGLHGMRLYFGRRLIKVTKGAL